MVTFCVSGLWHGANWTFVLWGALHGLALCIDKLLPKKNQHIIFRILGITGTFLFVSFSWIFFRADSFSTAWQIINGIFCLQEGIIQPFAWSIVAIIILAIATAIAIVKSRRQNLQETIGFVPILNLNTVSGLTIFFFISGLIICLAFTGESPFVYFQF